MKCRVVYFAILLDLFASVYVSPKFDDISTLKRYLDHDCFAGFKFIGYFKASYDRSLDSISVLKIEGDDH